MLKLTKTGIGLLTKQYRSVLKKCLLLNLGVFALSNIGFASDLGFLKDISDTSVIWGYFASHGYTQSYEWRGVDSSDLVFASAPAVNDYQLSIQIDGYFYQNEGTYRVLDISNISNAINSTSTSTVASSAAVNAVRELVPTNTNQLTNGAGFITKSVNDLTNYYTKSETYSRNEIANLDSLNYYYTFRVDERTEVTDSASFFQKDFSTLQKVDLQSKNPTHLRAFTKCDEVCPRPSERFSLSLSQEQMLKNDASVDAGTFSICSLQIENVNEKLSNVFEAYGGVKC